MAEKTIKQDVECWMTSITRPELVDIADLPGEKRDVILNGAKKAAEDLLALLTSEKIEAVSPGQFYVVVGYRSRPKDC